MGRAIAVAGDGTGRPVSGRHRGIATRWLALWWVTALLLFSLPATAQRVEGDRAVADGLYAAEIEVNSQTANERNVGFARGLAQVLGKLSGDRSSASRPGVGRELRQAEQYVRSYDYRQDEGVSATGAPSFKTMLVVRFEPDKVDGLAAALGLPIWPQPRPKPVLWLAIDDGSGPRLVGLPQAEAARPTLDRAKQRGYRMGLPNGSAAEQAVVGAIWRGDTAAVARASSRYHPPMQLVGKMYRSGGGWKADWIFVDAGRVLARWSEEGASVRSLLATGADGAADALMKRYAKPAAAGPAGHYVVAFTGIDSAEDYLRLAGYLQKLAVVRSIQPRLAVPGRVEFDLELISGMPGFKLMVDGDDVLVPEVDGDDLPLLAVPGVEATAPVPAGTPVFRLL